MHPVRGTTLRPYWCLPGNQDVKPVPQELDGAFHKAGDSARLVPSDYLAKLAGPGWAVLGSDCVHADSSSDLGSLPRLRGSAADAPPCDRLFQQALLNDLHQSHGAAHEVASQ